MAISNFIGRFAFPKSMTYFTCVLCFGEKERAPWAADSEGIVGGPFSFLPTVTRVHIAACDLLSDNNFSATSKDHSRP